MKCLRPSLCLAAMAVLMLACAGCGYRVAGTTSRLAPDVQTIAVPSFTNQTHVYHVETGLTAAVIRELNTRTKYRVVQTRDGADAVLTGTIVSAELAPVNYDSQTGRAASGLVTVIARVTLTARDGRVLYSNPNYVFRDQYQISNELATFFEEHGPALARLERDFARTLVSNLLEAF
ncbi:MAG: LptE family protein [Acidobacteriota bacterium]|nr:LptE family protein [Acidobacteriota bacterium]